MASSSNNQIPPYLASIRNLLDDFTFPRHYDTVPAKMEDSGNMAHYNYRGVKQHRGGKFVAQIKHPETRALIWLGTFDTATDAARAYNKGAIRLLGSHTILNLQAMATSEDYVTKIDLVPAADKMEEDSGNDRRHNYRGVRQRPWGKFVAKITHPMNRSRVWIGTFETAIDAAKAYDKAAVNLLGSDAILNFPETTTMDCGLRGPGENIEMADQPSTNYTVDRRLCPIQLEPKPRRASINSFPVRTHPSNLPPFRTRIRSNRRS